MNWELIFSTALTQALGPGVVVFALAAIGLNVQFGYTGLLNFGQAAFAAMGAYGLAIGVTILGWPFWWSLLLGMAGAVLLAILLGVSTLRLRADYLAIATVAAAEAIRRLFRAETMREWTGGAEGIRRFADTFRDYGIALGLERGGSFRYGPFSYPYQPHLWVMIVGWTLIGLSVLLVWTVMRSPWGRVLKAIREDEDAVRSLGKNAFSYKIQALTLGGVFGALAGFLQGLRLGNVAPDQYHTTFTFYVYAVLILGGAARVFGPVVGAAIFWGLFNFLTAFLGEAARLGHLPIGPLEIPVDGFITPSQVGPFVFVLLGVGIILMLIFRPQGIFGDRREISLNVR
jgi:branched-chain amino acid transport system permease protein